MLRVAVCILLGILGTSPLSLQPIFTFKTLSSIFRGNYDDCKICYGNNNCLTMNNARCKYYMEIEDVLQKTIDDEDEVIPELKESVDQLLFDIVEKASIINTTCIPFMSEYTDCTRENICTGCKRCTCEAHGEWNCTTVQQCRANDILNVDHKVLVSVMERLNNIDSTHRIKRAVLETPHKVKKITYDEIAEWLYGVKPIRDIESKEEQVTDVSQTKLNDDAKNNNSDTANDTILNESEHQADTDYLAFDEVLNNIAVDLKNYSRRKPQLDVERNETADMHNMNMEDNATTNNAGETDQFMNMLTEIEKIDSATELPTEKITKVFIDLLESSKKNVKYNETEYMNIDNKLNSEVDLFDDRNNIDEFNVNNIMKREILNVSHITEVSSTERIINISKKSIELKDKVLQPLSDIISEKEKELQELLVVKENLVTYMKSLNSSDIELNFQGNNTENNSNHYLSIYEMEVIPQLDHDLRRKNPQILDKYMFKLKRDVYEVLKDIISIKKLSDNGKLPEELKVLIRAMKYYVRSDKKGDRKYKNTRRQYDYDSNQPNPQSIKGYIIEMFELLDKDMPDANALSPISQTAKKILNRIIRNNYVDEFTDLGLKVLGSNYNITNNFTTIGNNWQEMAVNLDKSSLLDRLYAMKLLYLILTVDISKITDLLTLTKAHTKRSLNPNIRDEIFKNIHLSLQNVNDKITTIIRKQDISKLETNDNNQANKQKKIIKESFLKQLRKLFRNYKSDVEDLLQKRVPKSEIIRTVAKKKLSDLTRRKLNEYEEVMKKWQYDLDLIPKRYKRSPKDRNKANNRIKNILPKYLRGKIHPAIVAKDSMKVTKKGKTKKNSRAISASTMKNEIKS